MVEATPADQNLLDLELPVGTSDKVMSAPRDLHRSTSIKNLIQFLEIKCLFKLESWFFSLNYCHFALQVGKKFQWMPCFICSLQFVYMIFIHLEAIFLHWYSVRRYISPFSVTTAVAPSLAAAIAMVTSLWCRAETCRGAVTHFSPLRSSK